MTDADVARQIAAHADAAPDMAPDIDVRAIREAIGMTQVEFAAAYEFSVRTVQEWERGGQEAQRASPNAFARHQGRSRRIAQSARGGLEEFFPSSAQAPVSAYLIGGAYCRPPLFQSAFKPRLILIGEPWPTLRSKISP
jgi:DNA-binding XRE family transcriptional regulator